MRIANAGSHAPSSTTACPQYATTLPEQSYVGEDEFGYEAVALDRLDQQGRPKVHVKASIGAP
jgi:hypothetical protein